MGDTTSGLGGGLFGTMTPEQQMRMRQLMMAQALMPGIQGQTTPQSSGIGAIGQGLSPILNAVMMNRLMQSPQQQQAPVYSGPVTTPSGANTTSIMGVYGPQTTTPNPYAAPSSSVGPGMWGNIGNWITRQFGSTGSSGS